MPETPPTLAASSQSAVVTLATTNILGNQQSSNPAIVTLAAKPTDKSIAALQPVAGQTPLNDKDSSSSQNRSSNKAGDDGVLGDDPSAGDNGQRYDAGAHVVTLS